MAEQNIVLSVEVVLRSSTQNKLHDSRTEAKDYVTNELTGEEIVSVYDTGTFEFCEVWEEDA